MFRTSMTLDRANRAMTLLCAVLVLGAFVGVGWRVVKNGDGIAQAGALMLVFGLVVLGLVLAWAMSPREIVIDAGELRILRRAWRPLCVPLATIASATPLDRLG